MVETEYPFSIRVTTRLLNSKFNRGIIKKFEYSSTFFTSLINDVIKIVLMVSKIHAQVTNN